MKKKIAIIGGGASGLVCALEAAGGSCDVTLFEKNRRVGRKILATGNGRCNIGNLSLDRSCYHGHHPDFVSYALKQFGVRELKHFFSALGMEIVSVEDGRLFPMSLQASSVVDFLEDACIRKGVKVLTETDVKKIEKEGHCFVVSTDHETYRFDAVVIATGSSAMPTLGSSDAGLQFAGRFGHNIYPSFPVLVQLKSRDPFCAGCSGVKIDAQLSAIVNGEVKGGVRGDLLFTNYGLSGLAILDISRLIAQGLEKGQRCAVEVDLLPEISLSSLKKILQNRNRRFHEKPPILWLNGMVHKKIAAALLTSLRLDHRDALDTKALQRVAYGLKHFQIAISKTRGAKGAEVMAGGVDCSEIDAKTMESKLVKNLFFTGEVVDIDGKRGGYNLHWAWASGYLAARSVLASTKVS